MEAPIMDKDRRLPEIIYSAIFAIYFTVLFVTMHFPHNLLYGG